jgi:L-threonylcarbamoyladenylate synthase
MPDVLDWQSVSDPNAAVRQAAHLLRAGRIVALPTETGYVLAASGLSPEAVERITNGSAEPLPLAVRGAAEARDWVPEMSKLGRRLARRLWPGPVTFAFRGTEGGLCGRLPEAVRQRVVFDGEVRLRAPAHEAVLELLRQLPDPLVLSEVPSVGGAEGSAEPVGAARVAEVAGERVDLILNDGPGPYRLPPTVVRVDGAAWDVLREGPVSAAMVSQQSACLVIFVCTGNTCRSPLAEALFKKRLADRLGCQPEELPGRGFLVLSAGLAAMMGGPAAVEAAEVAQSYGADLSHHRSQPLTPELAAGADFLVAMTRSHVQTIAEGYSRLDAPPRLLNPEGEDVADPIGCDQGVYRTCGEQIWRHLETLAAEVAP